MESIFSKEFEQKLRAEYNLRKNNYKNLVKEVLYILRPALRKRGLVPHSVEPRRTIIKKFSSFYDKIKRKKIFEKQFELVKDIAAIRITCLYRSDLDEVSKVISESFHVLSADRSRTAASTFGYMGDHYIVKLPENYKGPRYDEIKDLPCEIQVRTILMDAWDSVSHHLDYKRETDVSTEIRDNFNSLSLLFHNADTQFAVFKKAVEDSRTSLERRAAKGEIDILDQDVNIDTLITYSRQKFKEKETKISSDLISDLTKAGYKKIRQVNEKVNIASKCMEEFEKEMMEKNFGSKLSSEGVIWASLDLTDKDFFDARFAKYRASSPKSFFDTFEKFRSMLSK